MSTCANKFASLIPKTDLKIGAIFHDNIGIILLLSLFLASESPAFKLYTGGINLLEMR